MSWDARMPRPRFSVSGKNRGNKTQVTMTKPITSDIYQGLFPIYHLSKGLGLLPVRFLSQAFGKYIGRIYTIDIIYGVCLLLLFIGAEIYGLHRDLRDGWVNSTRLKHQTALNVTIGDVFAVALLAAVGVLGAPFRWKYIQEIMTRLSEADEKLSYITPRKTKKFAIILTACALSYLIFISCLDVYSWDRQTKLKRKMPDKGPINYSPIYFLYIQAMMIEIQYTVATYNLNERFLRLNKNLESLLKYSKKMMKTNFHLIRETREQSKLAGYLRSDNETRNVGRAIRTTKISDWITSDGDETRDMVESISQLITVHSSLCDTNILINKAFGLPILQVYNYFGVLFMYLEC
ncbi:gustatory receptor for sugar taste 43a-like [Aphidius gifuensis]|uniref:gustatory receptor for sugar taste 43a-like n=1 Tax=Aphidius gifuensis TaxID=684658 RepID=UPI001CDB5899|nr:gustatory receptor for sugar taste 43a-like [Aphidius gifuensis]